MYVCKCDGECVPVMGVNYLFCMKAYNSQIVIA